MRVEYTSNNSGGSWRLSDDSWRALQAAGWTVRWAANDPDSARWVRDGRLGGALATRAVSPEVASEDEAISQWEQIVGMNADEQGCSCCGRPHNFSPH